MDKLFIFVLLKILSGDEFLLTQRVLDMIDSYKGSPRFLCMPASQMTSRLRPAEESKYDENSDLLVVMFPNDGPRTICD